MNKFYEVNVNTKIENDKGKIQVTKEKYLVDAISCLDAETKVNKMFTDEGDNLDFTVVNVKETKFLKVL